MKIAVMGTGGVGGAFGARLAAAGNDVTFVARGKHLEAIRKNGLQIVSPLLGDVHIQPARCTDDPQSIGTVDLVLFCVKLWDTESAAATIKPVVSPTTAVLSLQNGIRRDEVLRACFGKDNVLGGVSFIAATIKEAGVIDQRGAVQKLIFGEYSGKATDRVMAFDQACKQANIESIVSPDITKTIWEKFIYLVAMSSVLAAARQTIGPVRGNPRTRQLLVDVMKETIAVARARMVAIEDGLVERHMAYFDGLAPDVTASMQHDLSVGNKLELPWLAGAVVELGQELAIPTPVTRVLENILSPYVNGRT
jgi:2-dehydropantoate 2-reductase